MFRDVQMDPQKQVNSRNMFSRQTRKFSNNRIRKLITAKIPEQSGNLHVEFVRLAFDINRMKNKLMSLLLEIYKREIYKNHGCSTIYEYGFKYGRLSREVVQKALRTMKHLEDKPFLRDAVKSEGIHKVAVVATIATKETDGIFAKHVRNMSKPALVELAKELRSKRKMEDETKNTDVEENKNIIGAENTDVEENKDMAETGNNINGEIFEKCRAASGGTKIELDGETEALFLQLKKKYAKDSSNKYALKVLLQKLAEVETAKTPKKETIKAMCEKPKKAKDSPGTVCSHKQHTAVVESFVASKKYSPGTVCSHKQQAGDKNGAVSFKKGELQAPTLAIPHFESRYIKAQKKRDLLARHNHTCAYPNCKNPHDVIHHRTHFSFARNHKNIIPLCKTHHEFAHNGLIAHELKPAAAWRLNLEGKHSFADAVCAGKRTPKRGG